MIRALQPNAVVVSHPRQDQWTAWRKEALSSLLRQAKVGSWKAFVLPAKVVSVGRRQSEYTVSPYRRNDRRVDAFEEMADHCLVLSHDDLQRLGPALTTAFGHCSR